MPEVKLPPHDIDAEEAVIGSLLIDGTAIHKIALFLQQADFYSEKNREIYVVCVALYQREDAINQITVAQELARLGKLEMCGGAAYLSHVVSICPTSLDIEHYAKIVNRLSIMRGLISAADRIEAIGYEADPDVDASLDKAEDVLYNLRHGQTTRGFVHIHQLLDSYFETTPSEAVTGEHAEKIPQVFSGYAGLDEFLMGFQRSDLIVLAGRPSMGKTSLALSIARNAAVQQKACVAVFSLEMSRESLVYRLLSSEAGVDSRVIRQQIQTEAELERLVNAIGTLSETSLYIDDSPRLRIVELRSKSRRLHYERGIDLIVVDHLGLIDGQIKDRVQEISYISRSLKALARELNVPVLAVSQLSRASEIRASHKPQLSDLRDSGSIEQDADVVLFIYRDEYYYKTEEEWRNAHDNPDKDKEYPRGMADILIAKHRNGPTGQVKLRFRHNLAKFENIANEEPSLL